MKSSLETGSLPGCCALLVAAFTEFESCRVLQWDLDSALFGAYMNVTAVIAFRHHLPPAAPFFFTRSEAADIIKKWSAAPRRSQRGHRTYFIMHCHRGLPYDRLIVETHHHVARKRSADEAKPWVTR